MKYLVSNGIFLSMKYTNLAMHLHGVAEGFLKSYKTTALQSNQTCSSSFLSAEFAQLGFENFFFGNQLFEICLFEPNSWRRLIFDKIFPISN